MTTADANDNSASPVEPVGTGLSAVAVSPLASSKSNQLATLEYETVKIPGQQWPWWHWPWISIQFLVIAAIVAGAIDYGLKIRREAWDQTSDIHFRITMNSAIRWGHRTNELGVLNVYQHLVTEVGDEGTFNDPKGGSIALDYPPLRLFVVSRWEAWTAEQIRNKVFKPSRSPRAPWQPQYEFTRPMLMLNNACEIGGSVAMFLLVHFWMRRCRNAPMQPWRDPMVGVWPGLISALLLWFNPAVIFSAHCYPQWDVWILPAFLMAMYLGLLDQWLLAGICIGFVAMGKGQILVVTPVLVMWQLFLGNYSAIPRLLIGIFFAAALVASPWLTNNDQAMQWLKLSGIAMVLLVCFRFVRLNSLVGLVSGILLLCAAAVLTFWPWMHWHKTPSPPPHAQYVVLGLIVALSAGTLLQRRWLFSWAAGIVTAALFACAPLFGTSMDWYTVGIEFSARHWQLLYWCKAMNLGAILQECFDWQWRENIRATEYFSLLKDVSQTSQIIIDLWIVIGTACVVAWLIIRSGRQNSSYLTDAMLAACLLALSVFLWPLDGANYVAKLLHDPFPMRYLMNAAYLISITICAISMAVHYRRKSPMLFFAMVAPWVLMFTLLPQMQNRYLMWGAAFSATTCCFSLNGFMLYLLLAAISLIDTAVDMLYRSQGTETSQKWYPILGPMFPDLAWAVLLIAGIWLYLALPRWRIRSKQIQEAM